MSAAVIEVTKLESESDTANSIMKKWSGVGEGEPPKAQKVSHQK
jgi:hypothetical protein